MQPSAFVSVIIPVYNGSQALARAIASVLGQTYQNFELIIVDDCSGEPIEPTVKSFVDPRIKFYRHAQNKGAAAARNTGMRAAEGDFLAFLDSDDEFFPEKLETQIREFQRLGQDVGLVICNLDDSAKRDCPYVPAHTASGYVSASAFPGSIFSPPSSWMLRKNMVGLIGFFDEAIRVIEDADYFVRVLEQARIYYLNNILAKKYLSSERKGCYSSAYFLGNDLFTKKHFGRMSQDPLYLSVFYSNKGKDLSRVGRRREASQYFLKAFWVKPSIKFLLKYFRSLF